MRRTDRGQRTRQQIIEKSTILFTTNGYNHTSLSQILKATGLTKGGFYFHFKSKEDLGLAVIKSLEECWTREVLPRMLRGRDAREKLDYLLSYPGDCMCPQNSRPIWLLLTLTTEMIEVNKKFASMLQQIYHGWRLTIAAILEEGKLEGLFKEDIRAMDVASIILSNLMGANLQAFLNGDPETYNQQLSALKTVLFNGISQEV